MMGVLGGLALGGLLGAMFFGGAFEGIKMFDILIIAGLIFLVIWFLRRKSQPMAYAGQQPNIDMPSASTDFNALLREQSLDSNETVTDEITHELNETWIFRHDPASNDPTWFLAGIQQHYNTHTRTP